MAAARERWQFMQATLELCGESGYRSLTIEAVLGRAALPYDRFLAEFASVSACFAAAHEAETGRLYADLAAAALGPSGLRAVLEQLFHFVDAGPSIAAAIFTQVHVAGGPALDNYEATLERLSDAFDDACRKSLEVRHPPPPLAASFIVGGLEESVRRRLAEHRAAALWDDLPELTAVAVAVLAG